MKKIIILSIILNSFLIFSQEDSLLTRNQFNVSELKFIKEVYEWQKEDVLIINFRQPSSNCHYNNNENIEQSLTWWNDFYKQFDLANKKNIFIYSDKKAAENVINNKNYFSDKNDFFYNKLFKNDNSCYGIIIINKEGKYNIQNGEYTLNQIQNLIDNL